MTGDIRNETADQSTNANASTTTTAFADGQRNGTPNERHLVHWFRKGLRLHDNPAFYEGLKGAITFRCIFIIDPWFAGSSNVGINKWRFLLQCLEDLDHNLRKINSRLFVIRGQPADALPKLFKEWGTTCLTFEEDPEPFGKVRDQNITQLCKEMNISVVQVVSHTLYKLEKIMEKNGNKAPYTYNQFQGIIETMEPPPVVEMNVAQNLMQSSMTPTQEDHDERFGVPSLEELGFDTENLKPPVWIGGETEALARLERHLERKAWVASFGRPKMTPQSLLASQTGLSPYLRFGCLSVRVFYHQLSDLYRKIKKAKPPLSLHGQLLWREFFYCAATKNGNFDKMEGNPICVQIPWDKNAEALAKWANGQTGFPWIDAIMTQLREEGWIHHLARHAVVCFLTRGDLWISWEEGMKVFEELLLDADWSVNAGMWMWLSSSSFFQQFFHCYCPVRFGRKADPNGDYIRRYLPVLKNFPTRYIHEPWNAPESVQKAAKCIIGREYSLPMVDHAKVSRINMERLRQVYNQLYKYRDPKIGIDKNEIILAKEMIKAAKAQNDHKSHSPSQSLTITNSGKYQSKSPTTNGLSVGTIERFANRLDDQNNDQQQQENRYPCNTQINFENDVKYHSKSKAINLNESNCNYVHQSGYSAEVVSQEQQHQNQSQLHTQHQSQSQQQQTNQNHLQDHLSQHGIQLKQCQSFAHQQQANINYHVMDGQSLNYNDNNDRDKLNSKNYVQIDSQIQYNHKIMHPNEIRLNANDDELMGDENNDMLITYSSNQSATQPYNLHCQNSIYKTQTAPNDIVNCGSIQQTQQQSQQQQTRMHQTHFQNFD